ncbi:hypothetical protein [Pseudoxanthomonas sacheonensis]|uniref:Uncharacterized protein n=1 Tax=Pseudoxanthomonas sacheonensis TaxID=443615 RepID=A0ABU1RUZ8_9GAMM|nr:hypothetical protein [Pseudoxanthomonas sacheonensis]MDR6842412.1 hypothetical protein [Pseudoxanthomonas sacheonensis]
MSRWSDQFKNHAFHTDWASLAALLEGASAVELEDAEEFARLRKVFVFVSGLLDGMDPEIVNANALTNMHSPAQAVINEVSAYFSNSNVGHLHNANASMDTIVVQASQTPFMAFGTAKASLTKAATAYADAMHSHAEKYKEATDTLVEDASTDYDTLDGRVITAGESIGKLESRVESMETQLPLLLATFNTDFQNSEKARSDRYDLWTTSYQDKLDLQFTEAAKKFSIGLDTMGDYLSQAGKVLGSVVDTGQAGAYATYATEEKKSANVFRISAILLMGAAALVLFLPELVHAAKAASQYEMDWKAALYRLPFSLILFAPALYLAKESAKHRTNEVVNRRRQHILTTIGPYLALLAPAKADEIKAEVAKSIFADNLPIMDEKSPEAANVLAQMTNLIDLVLRKNK